jgi:polyhydroxyalkanoate synthase
MLPCNPQQYTRDTVTVMNNERADDLRPGTRHGPAAVFANRHEATSREPTDPPPTTPFDIAYEGALLRLRHYQPEGARRGPPVLLVYSFFKRPFVVDLLPGRSIVQSLLRQGFSVYLADWLPPSSADVQHGLHDYVEWELATAVERIQHRERVTRVRLVGCCLGAFVAAVYAALHPQNVERLVVLALPFESKPPFAPAVAEYLTRAYGNVPAWWIRAGLNRRVADPRQIPAFLATELAEPELAHPADGSEATSLAVAFEKWLDSDVPFAGQLFLDIMGDAYGRGRFAASRLEVGGRPVRLAEIRCPVLNVCAERDKLVPAEDSLAFGRHLGRSATNLVFACGHLGLMLSRPAHAHLWPHVAKWLNGDDAAVADAAGDSHGASVGRAAVG